MSTALCQAKRLLLEIMEGRVRPFMTKTEQMHILFILFDVNRWQHGEERIREALKNRAGERTYHALRGRAEELGIIPNRPDYTEPCRNDGEYITRLQATANRLRHSGTEFGRIEAENIERAIAQIEGRLVAGPPLRD